MCCCLLLCHPEASSGTVGMTHEQPDHSYELSLNSRNTNAYIKAVYSL